jgi:hypothetical protein
MLGKSGHSTLVSFKVEAELAELLNRLPNKSEFIRKALAAQLRICCPLCDGKGLVPHGIHEHYARLIDVNRTRSCVHCGGELRLSGDTSEPCAEDRARLAQFLLGGPLYCDSCYDTAPPCEECGWHIEQGDISDHMRLAHKDGVEP